MLGSHPPSIMDTSHTPESPEKKRFASIRDAVEAAGAEAAAKAKEAAPGLKKMAADTAHDISYAAAYGTFFVSTLAYEFLPKPFKETMAKGAAAGRSAARNARVKAGDAMRPTPAQAPADDEIAIGGESMA